MKRYIIFFLLIFALHSAYAQNVTIDGLKYYLYADTHVANIDWRNAWVGELDIPSEIQHNGETFTVNSMAAGAFYHCVELTRVMIPKTIDHIVNHVLSDDPNIGGAISPFYMNPFWGCTTLVSIEVDENNPSMRSVEGALFSKDGSSLYCYPIGKRQEAYTIPDGVEWIGGNAFSLNQYLTTLTIPSSIKHIYNDAISYCSKLKDVYCYADNVPTTNYDAFMECPIASATLHVPAGSVSLYKSTAPWSCFGNIVAISDGGTSIKAYSGNKPLSPIYDLSGRKIDSSLFTLHSSLKRGLYIQNGKKVAVK